jgi:hypothetical protein
MFALHVAMDSIKLDFYRDVCYCVALFATVGVHSAALIMLHSTLHHKAIRQLHALVPSVDKA